MSQSSLPPANESREPVSEVNIELLEHEGESYVPLSVVILILEAMSGVVPNPINDVIKQLRRHL